MLGMVLLGLGAAAQMGLQIGDTVGPVEMLSVEDFPTTMDNYGDRPGTVVVFLSARCMVTDAQMAEMIRVHQASRLEDVYFVGICSNPAESGEELRMFGQRRGVIFPIYRDPDGAIAKRFGASVTPEFFLLDKDAKLRYHGGLGEGEASLEHAIAQLLAGKDIEATETEAKGTPIDAPGPKREIDDPYGYFSFSSELIFEKTPWAAVHHCSTLTEAANGDLLCLWYGGSYESADDQVLFLARRKPVERIWQEPEIVVHNPGQPPGNALIFRDGLDRIWIVWGRMEVSRPVRRGAGWGKCSLMFRISDDNGMTWSEDKELEGSFGSLPRNTTITLDTGELILPLTGHVEGQRGSFFLKTADNGATWEHSGLIKGGSQPTFIQRSDGSLLALMRRQPRIMKSESFDRGKTWTPSERTDFKNPDSGIAMTRLNNGHLLLVFNDTDQEDRTPLSIARSVDEGRTWEPPEILEARWGEYSYPCIVQTLDGKIHITYTYRRWTIKHVEFDENWLTHMDRPN